MSNDNWVLGWLIIANIYIANGQPWGAVPFILLSLVFLIMPEAK
jgi:hypothetical protein